MEIDLAELPRSEAIAILGAIGLPLATGMTLESITEVLGEPLDVPPRRTRGEDRLLADLAASLQQMLDRLAPESRLFETTGASEGRTDRGHPQDAPGTAGDHEQT